MSSDIYKEGREGTLMSHDLAKAPRGFPLLAMHVTLSDSTQN